MLRRLTAKQFLEWQAYARLEPFDAMDRRQDWRTAAILKQIFDSNQRLVDALCAVNGMEKHKRPKFIDIPLKDFLLNWEGGERAEKPARKQTWQEQWAIVQMINDLFGGTRH